MRETAGEDSSRLPQGIYLGDTSHFVWLGELGRSLTDDWSFVYIVYWRALPRDVGFQLPRSDDRWFSSGVGFVLREPYSRRFLSSVKNFMNFGCSRTSIKVSLPPPATGAATVMGSRVRHTPHRHSNDVRGSWLSSSRDCYWYEDMWLDFLSRTIDVQRDLANDRILDRICPHRTIPGR